jgi:hypothetical protein
VLPASHVPVKIDAMRNAEAVSLIATGLPVAQDPAARLRLTALSDRLGNWAQMLSIANGWLRKRVSRGETLSDAIAGFETRLKKGGLDAFDPKNETQGDKAIRLSIEASLEELDPAERTRFGELAVLPEDKDVSLDTISDLWAETGELDTEETDDLAVRLDDLSLLYDLDLRERTLRLHDNITWYLRDRIGADACRAAHAAMVRALGKSCKAHWDRLPTKNHYGWAFVILHLRGAGQDETADRLLTDYAWIKAKLHASGAAGLFTAYRPESSDAGARLVGRAIALSVPALAANPRELPWQIFGRLGHLADATGTALAQAARDDRDLVLTPRWPSLTSPGAERLRLVGHDRGVTSAAFSPDGARIVTASMDKTARLWDAATGEPIHVLTGHDDGVSSAALSPDGARIVTCSRDNTARIWDAASGAEIVRITLDAAATALSISGTAIALGDALGRLHVFDAPNLLSAESRDA